MTQRLGALGNKFAVQNKISSAWHGRFRDATRGRVDRAPDGLRFVGGRRAGSLASLCPQSTQLRFLDHSLAFTCTIEFAKKMKNSLL